MLRGKKPGHSKHFRLAPIHHGKGYWIGTLVRWTGADKGLDRVGAELERGDRGPRDKPLHGSALGQDRPAAGRHKRGPYGPEYVVAREELERARRENPAPVTVVAPNPRSSKG